MRSVDQSTFAARLHQLMRRSDTPPAQLPSAAASPLHPQASTPQPQQQSPSLPLETRSAEALAVKTLEPPASKAGGPGLGTRPFNVQVVTVSGATPSPRRNRNSL